MEQQAGLFDSHHESETPSAGDGICPSEEHFDSTATATYQRWRSNIAAAASRKTTTLDLFSQLKDLLRHVPPFRAPHSSNFSLLEGTALQIKCLSEWKTTNDLDCKARWKSMDHYQVIGICNPIMYEYTNSSETQAWREMAAVQPSLATNFMLAWTYILSCRWVEILQESGGQAELWQCEKMSAHTFWNIILNHGWRATFTRNSKTYYAPWSLSKTESDNIDNLVSVKPDSRLALETLGNVCASDEMRRQSLALLVSVLVMIDPMEPGIIKLPKPGPSPEPTARTHLPFTRPFNEILPQLDRCITLICSLHSVLSLLSAVFFDPTIPSNLVGAQMTGLMEAISEIKDDHHTLVSALSAQCPRVALLWPTAICSGKLDDILASAGEGTPPLSLPVATWTGTLQSFIQVSYPPVNLEKGKLLRASEFALTWCTSPKINAPFTPSPPFGISVDENLNIETRKHLRHDHRLIAYRMFWILESGDRLPGLGTQVVVHSPEVQIVEKPPALIGKRYHCIDNPAGASENATSNLFYWFQNLEDGGLWLGMTPDGGPEERRALNHQWISGFSSDDEPFSGSQASSEGAFDKVPVELWLNN
ncbi:MAG: hypothetical protein M1837_001051 [Sclerophora amabilis]|nr:MAG: hypothetical protein M1837_001051 [Sclerophora amabilis]